MDNPGYLLKKCSFPNLGLFIEIALTFGPGIEI